MIKKVLYFIPVAIILTALFYQVKAELYIASRKKSCCILSGKSRVSYKPIAIYYSQVVLFDFDFQSEEVLANVLSQNSKCPQTCKGSIGGWEQYLVSSYFTEEEKIELIKKYLPDSPLLN